MPPRLRLKRKNSPQPSLGPPQKPRRLQMLRLRLQMRKLKRKDLPPKPLSPLLKRKLKSIDLPQKQLLLPLQRLKNRD